MHKFRCKMNQNDANNATSQGSLFAGSNGKLLSCASEALPPFRTTNISCGMPNDLQIFHGGWMTLFVSLWSVQ